MAYRSDTGRIAKYEDTDDGFLRCFFRFRKLGNLEYLNLDGSKRVEVVTEDELYKRKSLRTASLKPVTYNHPSGGMVTPQNARELQRGMTGSTIIRDDPYAVIVGVVTDAEMIDAIKSRELPDVSSGYWSKTVNQDGAWLQTDVRYNHFAGCKYGRAGPDVGFLGFNGDSLEALQDKDIAVQLIDSADLDPSLPIIWTPYNFESKNTPMLSLQDTATMITELRIDDETTVKIGTSEGEQAIARYFRDALNANKDLNSKFTQAEAKIDQLQVKLDQAIADCDKQKARADIAESKLVEAGEKKADADEIKTAFDQGYQRHLLEVTAIKFLPSDLKIDAAMPDKDIKLAVIKEAIKLKADSDEAKRYDAQSDAYVDAAYDLIVNADSSLNLRASANNPERNDMRINSKQTPGEQIHDKAKERNTKKLSLSRA